MFLSRILYFPIRDPYHLLDLRFPAEQHKITRLPFGQGQTARLGATFKIGRGTMDSEDGPSIGFGGLPVHPRRHGVKVRHPHTRQPMERLDL